MKFNLKFLKGNVMIVSKFIFVELSRKNIDDMILLYRYFHLITNVSFLVPNKVYGM